MVVESKFSVRYTGERYFELGTSALLQCRFDKGGWLIVCICIGRRDRLRGWLCLKQLVVPLASELRVLLAQHFCHNHCKREGKITVKCQL